jgi:hypothetical protein
MDLNRQDYSLILDDGFQAETIEPTFMETFKTTYAYNWMPMIDRYQEAVKFDDRPFDMSFDRVQAVKDMGSKYYPYMSDIARAKDREHFDYIIGTIDQSLQRRIDLSNGGIVPQMAGHIIDPSIAFAMIPGFNLALGGTILSSAARFGTSGFLMGAAMEARRAPFDINLEGEVATNLAMSTAFGAGLGGTFKALTYAKPFAQSTANKIARRARGEKVERTFNADGTVKLDDGKAPAVKLADDDYDFEVNDFISTPMKKELSDTNNPREIKEFFVKLAYNQSMTLKSQRKFATPMSVTAMKVTHNGVAFNYEDVLRGFYTRDTVGAERAPQLAGVFLQRTKDFDEWFNDTFTRYIQSKSADPAKAIKAKEGLTDAQKQAWTFHDDIIKSYDAEGRYVGAFGDDIRIKAQIKTFQKDVADKQQLIADLDDARKQNLTLTKKQQALLDKTTEEMDRLADEIETLKTALAEPTRKNYAFPIYYNKEKLADSAEREALTQIFENRYQLDRLDNPDVPRGSTAREDAERTVSRILGEDGSDLEISFSGMPKGKHLAFRKTNVDEWEVADFMKIDIESMYAYFDHMGSRIEFARAFKGKNINDILDEIEATKRAAKPKGVKSATWEKEVARTRKNFAAEFDRTMGSIQRNPDRYDNKTAYLSKQWAGWTYLDQTGISATTDVGSVVLAHGVKDTMRAGLAAITDMNYSSALAKNTRQGGEMLDMTRNFLVRRVIGDSNRRHHATPTEKFVETTNRIYYTANLLGPVTVGTKFLDQMLVNDKFIKLSQKRIKGNLDEVDEMYLNRYGIDYELSKYITEMPVSKHQSMDFVFANTDEWPTTSNAEREFKRRYQAATSAHANNVVIYGQQFDKPLIMDGILYMRDNPFFRANRKRFPIDEKASTRSIKYVRLESGMMTLPFTFMNFAFAANNKILAAIRDPNRRYRLQGVMALLGLSYLSLQLKKDDWWFEKKDSPEIMMRVVDHSGILALYADLGYMGLHMAVGAGMVDPETSIVKPKYTPDGIDAITEPFGAPVGQATEYVRGAIDFINGRTSEGADRYYYNAPFIGLPIIKADMDELYYGNERGRF